MPKLVECFTVLVRIEKRVEETKVCVPGFGVGRPFYGRRSLVQCDSIGVNSNVISLLIDDFSCGEDCHAASCNFA